MRPRTEDEFKNDINVKLNRIVKIVDQFNSMSRKRIYKDLSIEVKQKSFLGAMDIMKTHIDRTQNKIFGTDEMLSFDINDYLKKAEEQVNTDEQETEG